MWIRFVVVVLCLLVIVVGHYTYVHEHFSVNTQRTKYLSLLSCVQTDATTPNIVGQQWWELLRPFARSSKFDRFQTLRNNSQQHATTCNRVWKRTQHVTSNNVASVCTGLKTQLWAQTSEFFKATFTKNSDKIKFVDRYPPKIFRATIK